MSSTFKTLICPNCHVPVPDGLIHAHFLSEKGRFTAHLESDTTLTRQAQR